MTFSQYCTGVIAAVATALSACNTQAPPPAPILDGSTVILMAGLTGGCNRGSSVCPSTVIYADGRYQHVRGSRPDNTTTDGTGNIPESAIQAWLQMVHKTDFDHLTSSLKPGKCRGCFDGSDDYLHVLPDRKNITFESNVVSFDYTKPFFKHTNSLLDMTNT